MMSNARALSLKFKTNKNYIKSKFCSCNTIDQLKKQ